MICSFEELAAEATRFFGIACLSLQNDRAKEPKGPEVRWGNLGLNQGPTGYESAALTTELLPRECFRILEGKVAFKQKYFLLIIFPSAI